MFAFSKNRSRHFLAFVLMSFAVLFSVGTTACGGEVLIGDITPTTFSVVDNTLTMNGDITSDTPAQLEKVFEENPNIHTVVMGVVPGSVDDEANLKAATWISKRNLTFILNADSEIASGGTDFFLAGKERVIHRGAKVGVHSWASGGGEVATDFPVGHQEHSRYIDYYQAVGWPKQDAEAFYYFTIEAAPADSIYWMSDEELITYKIATEPIR